MRVAAILLAFLFVVLFVAVAVVDTAFRRHLKTHHPEVWQSLGAPTFPRNESVRNSLRLQGYLWTSRYRSLADSDLNALAHTEKVLGLLYVASFVGMILAVSLG